MSLTITLQLPKKIEDELRDTPGLDADVQKSFALELFRRGKLSHFELSQILGLDRFETDAFLKRNNVFEGSLTMEDLEEQSRTIERVLEELQKK